MSKNRPPVKTDNRTTDPPGLLNRACPCKTEVLLLASLLAPVKRMGLTGLEPVTLRLSSACSNQLSYRPVSSASPKQPAGAWVDVAASLQASRGGFKGDVGGGKGIRTPDIQLAKLALYQLSYAPAFSTPGHERQKDAEKQKLNCALFAWTL